MNREVTTYATEFYRNDFETVQHWKNHGDKVRRAVATIIEEAVGQK